jgi:hypothetical protein
MDTYARARRHPVWAFSLMAVLALALFAVAATSRHARPPRGASRGPAARDRYPMVN